MSTTVQTPASRRHDPITSSLAEAEINASGTRARQQRIVNALVALFPRSTSAELAHLAERYCLSVAHRVYRDTPGQREAEACQLDRFQIARRLSECETAGAVQRAEARKCSVKGRKSLTWEAVR